MDTAIFVSPRIQKILRGIEWFLLAYCTFSTLSSLAFTHSAVDYAQLGLFVGTVSVLSFFFPVHRPLWVRRSYIAVEMLILLPIVPLPINDYLFFELFVLKACFLLSRRDVIIVVITAASLSFGQVAWHLPAMIERYKPTSLEYFSQPGQILRDVFLEYLVGCTFVVLFGVVFAAEQRSRHRAEVLSQEVEALATKLERTRIARDIHDSLGHSLTTLDVQLALAQRYSETDAAAASSPSENQIKLQQSLSAAQRLTTQCLAEARQSLHTMREPTFSLEEALSTLVEQMRQSFVVNLEVRVRSLPQQLSYQLYLMAKEGLVNVQKHAHSSRVSLSVVATDGQLTMTLADNGCGFDVHAPRPGYGLQGLKERSQLLGGQFTVYSQPDSSQSRQGTTLQVTVPLRQQGKTPKNKLSTLSTQLA